MIRRNSNIKRILPVLLAGILTAGLTCPALAAVQNKKSNNNKEETLIGDKPEAMKGTWLSFVDEEDLLKNKTREDFDKTFDSICRKLRDNGGNTIFVHVRSHNDAIYPSAVYPWSMHMLSGTDPGYDPLKDMVKIAHKEGLAIHAWINPYGYRNGMISEHPELANDVNILAGIRELLDNYEIDGIHFDDYFPPLGAEALNNMVHSVHELCAEKGRVFGISPQGNIDNNMAMGADVTTWLSKIGYVDYIAPQIYWTDNYGENGNTKMSTERLEAWAKLNTADIPMYVGMALYRAGNEYKDDPGWMKQNDNLKKQAEKAVSLGYDGYIIYNTKSQIKPNGIQNTEIGKLKDVKW